VTRVIERRDGKVYLDFGQNGHGRLLVSPYSVRPLPGAPVSAPLRWSEVNGRLSLDKFNIKSLPRRLARMKEDPLSPVLTETPDLEGALARLAERYASSLEEVPTSSSQ
jgi:bifunctional non-homologous end joining protein LigD